MNDPQCEIEFDVFLSFMKEADLKKLFWVILGK